MRNQRVGDIGLRVAHLMPGVGSYALLKIGKGAQCLFGPPRKMRQGMHYRFGEKLSSALIK
ncbi:MAG: hypothetical protein U1E78_13030 [Gammaproteobacteria bacterium]